MLAACSGAGRGGEGAGAADELKREVLAAFGECALGAYRRFEEKAGALTAASEGARAAWREAMDAWQVAELFQFGPAAVAGVPGGRDLRDQIYGWPLFSRCLVEQTLVARGYERPGFAATEVISARTLGAGEYLLFHEGTDNACSPTLAINTSGAWQALAPEELAARKRAYAAVVSAGVLARARELVRAWAPDGEDFGRALATAGAGSAVYRSAQEALNGVSDALFYVDIRVKDRKVGPPVGRRDCMARTCPELLESRFAGRAKDNVRRNLEGARALLFGCAPVGGGGEGLGFDDLLSARGQSALVERLRAQLAAVEAALEAVPGERFEEALGSDLASMFRLHDALGALVITLKTQFTGVLDLTVPAATATDND